MNIPPILERLLLSNEAVFKNASLGLSGQNMVFVPPGKTAVLLEFSIEPFVNDVSQISRELFNQGSSVEFYKDVFQELIKRLTFQMQIINDAFATYFTFHDSFEIIANATGIGNNVFLPTVNINFKGKKEEIFIYTDRSMYFNFIYPFGTSGELTYPALNAFYTDALNGFSAKIQDLPQNPITFKKNNQENFVISVQTGNGLDSYFPVGKQINSTLGFDNDSQQEYLHFPNTTVSENINNTIVQPVPSDTGYAWEDLFKIPLVNVKYALINKRASDYGIVAPKNL